MIQFITKKGDIIRLVKPYRKKPYKRKIYRIQAEIISGIIQEDIKAINIYIAIIKYCIKHPIVLFKLN